MWVEVCTSFSMQQKVCTWAQNTHSLPFNQFLFLRSEACLSPYTFKLRRTWHLFSYWLLEKYLPPISIYRQSPPPQFLKCSFLIGIVERCPNTESQSINLVSRTTGKTISATMKLNRTLNNWLMEILEYRCLCALTVASYSNEVAIPTGHGCIRPCWSSLYAREGMDREKGEEDWWFCYGSKHGLNWWKSVFHQAWKKKLWNESPWRRSESKREREKPSIAIQCLKRVREWKSHVLHTFNI